MYQGINRPVICNAYVNVCESFPWFSIAQTQVVSDLLGQISTLRAGSTCSLRVVTVARGEHALAVGVLGVPCVDRNPHVLIASDGHQSVKDLHWRPWDKEALLLNGQLKEWSKESDRPAIRENGIGGAHTDLDQAHGDAAPGTQLGWHELEWVRWSDGQVEDPLEL